MTKVEYRGFIVAAILTFISTLLFFTVSVFVKFSDGKIPREIKIYLAQDEILPTQKTEPKPSAPESSDSMESDENVQPETSEPEAPQEQAVKEEKPASPSGGQVPAVKKEAAAPKPAAKPQPKPASKQASSASSKPAPAPKNEAKAPEVVQSELKKSVDELMAEQQQKKKTAVWDDTMFDDDDAVTSSSSSSAAKPVQKSSVSGSAGTSSSSGTKGATTVGQDSSRNTASSAATKSALSNIRKQSFGSTVSDGVKSTSSLSVERSSDGKYNVQFAGGATRKLLRPSSPSIMISEENASLVSVTLSVKITFSVLANGSVPVGNISFSPSSVLPVQIQKEIRDQISAWSFSQGTETNTAAMDYTIQVK